MNMNFGWKRDLPDIRDYTDSHPDVEAVLKRSASLNRLNHPAPQAPQPPQPVNPAFPANRGPVPHIPHAPNVLPVLPTPEVATATRLPATVDLRKWCSPIDDQGDLGSCTSQACVGLVEYYQNRAFGRYLNVSRLFVYKTTRNLLGWTGDTGAYLRSTMKALVLFGAPPEQYWPYNISKFDNEPTAFTYAFADNYKAIKYYRLDPPDVTSDQLLTSIKTKLAAGLPSMFGFSVYSSISNSPDIPFPKATDSLLGGHAVIAVGYSDSQKVGNSTGALLIRNSWSTIWGDAGYGWLPFSYVTKGLAADFWTLLQASFVDTDLFR